MHGCAAGEHCRRADLVVALCAKPSRSAVRVASQARCSPCSGDWCRRASGAGTGAMFPGPSVFPSHRSPHLNRGCGERLLIFAPALESEEGIKISFLAAADQWATHGIMRWPAWQAIDGRPTASCDGLPLRPAAERRPGPALCRWAQRQAIA